MRHLKINNEMQLTDSKRIGERSYLYLHTCIFEVMLVYGDHGRRNLKTPTP
jgi:hypothetical protein